MAPCVIPPATMPTPKVPASCAFYHYSSCPSIPHPPHPSPSCPQVTLNSLTIGPALSAPPPPPPGGSSSSSSKLSGGAIAGIVVGSLGGIALVLAAVILLTRYDGMSREARLINGPDQRIITWHNQLAAAREYQLQLGQHFHTIPQQLPAGPGGMGGPSPRGGPGGGRQGQGGRGWGGGYSQGHALREAAYRNVYAQ